MITAFTQLLLFQFAGEFLVRFFSLPLPGPVVGMALCFVFLILRGEPSHELRQTGSGLLQHMSLLFIPAGVGVMQYFDRVEQEWLPIGAALLASTVLAIAVTAGVLKMLGGARREDA
ncbi:MAG: CidA/LrgA family protein [Proteobacteria bacterium]|nr:CidA/LrgA family protein [Pseudomonadota bacterium]HQR03949.1 CidA/LrgA family protein [Rhodocyclaceae bacterium]